MGGRVAEEMLLGPENITTGAGSDMAQATELARRFCMVYSMSELGLASYAQSEPSGETRAHVDREVDAILKVRNRGVRCCFVVLGVPVCPATTHGSSVVGGECGCIRPALWEALSSPWHTGCRVPGW
jgi:hypothetical protein